MIYILSWTTKKHLKNTFQATSFKVEENSRTFEGLAQKFKDFSRKNEIQGLLKDLHRNLRTSQGLHLKFTLLNYMEKYRYILTKINIIIF